MGGEGGLSAASPDSGLGQVIVHALVLHPDQLNSTLVEAGGSLSRQEGELDVVGQVQHEEADVNPTPHDFAVSTLSAPPNVSSLARPRFARPKPKGDSVLGEVVVGPAMSADFVPIQPAMESMMRSTPPMSEARRTIPV